MKKRFLANQTHQSDPVWHVQLVLLIAAGLEWFLPSTYVVGPHYSVPGLEILLLLALGFTTPRQKVFSSWLRRLNVFLLAGAATIANGYGLYEVAHQLLQKGSIANGRELILAAINIYLTNIAIFALWYWEMDGGGPGQRRANQKHEQDFLFPQQQDDIFAKMGWSTTFIDYLYVSSTNAMAFSPTDTLPLTRRAKMMMLIQASVSLIAIALVAARAVNILN